jgi:glycosyltransferase involved in cell wall biosynthesis
MQIAFLTTRLEKPSFRFRAAQFIPYLERHGAACTPLLIPPAGPRRMRLLSGLGGYDVVVVQKKLLRPLDRFILRRAARRLVYDVDDAVMYHEDARTGPPRRARMRRFRGMVRMSDLVLAGNETLRGMAARHSARVFCFPTVVDTERYRPAARAAHDPPVVGWSGSRSTNPYLDELLPVLDRLARRVSFTLRVVSDTADGIDLAGHGAVRAEFSRWSAADEVAEFSGFDIGLMPLPDTPWARGKCALKALVYMACGVPAVCAPVGVVSTIITNGRNGFLASSPAEWEGALERLLRDPALRQAVSARGRETVERRYSLAAHAPRLLAILADLCAKGAP